MKTLTLEPRRSFRVRCYCRRVLAAVELDDRVMLEADEVGDIRADRRLTAEFRGGELAIA